MVYLLIFSSCCPASNCFSNGHCFTIHLVYVMFHAPLLHGPRLSLNSLAYVPTLYINPNPAMNEERLLFSHFFYILLH